LAILPRSMGTVKPGSEKKRADPKKFIPEQRGGLLLANPKEEESPYTFSDSPAYLAKKKFEEDAKRAAELEGKDETRGFLRSVEELGKKQKWEEAFNVLERRTAVPSGLFLVTRALLRWKFHRYSAAFRDIEDALKTYGSSAKAGPLAAALSSFARICIGSEVRDRGSCSKEMKELVAAWEQAEHATLNQHALGKGLFHPREEPRLSEPCQVIEGMEAQDGSYVATTGLRIGYVFLKNLKDANAPLVVHFHGTAEAAADYRKPALAEKYRDLPVHLLVVDYRGYGWSAGEPSLATFLRDAEPLAEKLPELIVQHGLAWPYPSGLILSGRSLGAQVAVHLAALFPALFRGLLLDSAVATSATGDRLGRAPERAAALQCWRRELERASLEVLQPLDTEFWCLSVLEKIRAYDGQLLLLHGIADETVPYEASESLHAAATTRRKEIILIEGAGHNNIGHHEAYWTAKRRFSLKIQLEDSVPKVGATVEHLCAVCAEKAVSKCGRCQKVWYCGRKHQAEHWKEHKLTCAGGPPEPKPKVEPEAEACLIAAVIADVESDRGLGALRRCLASLGAQPEPLQALHVSWHASSQGLADQVAPILAEFKSKHQRLRVVDTQVQGALSAFEHAKAMVEAMAQEAPAHAWITLLDIRSMWSSRYTTVVLPALRKAAADARIVAVSCRRHAWAAKDGAELPENSAQVDAAIKAGTAVVGEEEEPEELRFSDLVVRIRAFRGFFEATPAGALAHGLCAHRFRHRLEHTFGKRVQVWKPPEGEWLRWLSPADRVLGAGASAEGEDAGGAADAPATRLMELDRERGAALHSGTRPPAGEAPAGGESSGPEDVSQEPVPGMFASADEAAEAVARLRRAIERKVIQSAGETMSAKDMRALAMEETVSFLEETNLDTVVGIQRWAKQTSTEIFEAAAHEFGVEISEK